MRTSILLTLLMSACGGDAGSGDMSTVDMATLPPLPSTFLWGSATAATQVEGNVNNDWSAWASIPGHIANGQMIGTGDNNYALYDQDHAQAQAMGHNAYRFSLEWSRIEPTQGTFDMTQIQHYKDVIASVKAHGLKPVVTLYHYALPLWVQNPLPSTTSLGGWTNTATADAYVTFVSTVVPYFVDDVDTWITINEPVVQVDFGYFQGSWPPGEVAATSDAALAVGNLVDAHARAYDAIHSLYQTAGKPVNVTITHYWALIDPATPGTDDAAAQNLHHALNEWYLDAITKGDFDTNLMGNVVHHPEWVNKLDVLGIDYYRRMYVKGGSPIGALAGIPYDDPNAPQKADNGWEIYPEGMHRALTEAWNEYHLPILVTENGVADAADKWRPWFIVSHVEALQRAVVEGVDVRGYLHWSLMDNFEWADGYKTRFGLEAVDYTTPGATRTPRPSAAVYTQIIQASGVPWELANQYASPPQ
jgi:beta-glucosidase